MVDTFEQDDAWETGAAHQQTESTDTEGIGLSEFHAPRSLLEEWGTVLGLVVPVSLVICVGAILWTQAQSDTPSSASSRDRFLNWIAWFSGREYDTKSRPYSSQYNFKVPEIKSFDWDEHGRKNEEMLRSIREQWSIEIDN
jgi:hypothetical protein